ncbi:MAG: response regulator, partial [Bacteroidales bacterium]|nr:response regulator [Bacteroidales bacterium]
WWAWAIYIIAFGACVFYYIYSRIAKRTLALSLEKERFEKQQIEQLNHEKLVFFTNVSHEFRTPLTLIMSHTDMLLQNHTLNPQVSDTIWKIRKNTQQMNNLISELLEFRKLEQNHETICLKKQDIMAFLREIFLSFIDHAHHHNIDYTCRLSETPLLCRFDPKLMERVFFNLLSNAFKYTNDGKSISLWSEVTDEEIRIHITDTGIGIPEKDTERIFARFYRSMSREKEENLFSSTGIGLALTRSIVEKHHGSIGVKSTVGRGSTFTVTLPRRESVFEGDENVRLEDTPETPAVTNETLPTDTVLPTQDDIESETKETYTLLLVEDNEELLQVLQELFSPFYRTVLARNGREGLEQVRQAKPDLIISDIMMPEMSGTEMCLQIKNNIDTCHIPVILLTALDSTEQNIEGLNRGADDYVTKPFHTQLLLARANNLIRNRLLMQHQFNKKPLSEIDLTSINPMDKELLKQIVDIIEQHIDDTSFDISILCQEMGVSRSMVYSKFKSLTGMTPNNFLLNYRLKHAATMLRRYPEMPVAEVGDRCGFSTPVYFSRCFKAQYGCTPQQYKREAKNPS